MAARIFRSPPQPQAALAPRASPEVAADSYTTPWDVSRTRTDIIFLDENAIIDILSRDLTIPDHSKSVTATKGKIWSLGFSACHPFFILDFMFMAHASDMRKLCNFDCTTEVYKITSTPTDLGPPYTSCAAPELRRFLYPFVQRHPILHEYRLTWQKMSLDNQSTMDVFKFNVREPIFLEYLALYYKIIHENFLIGGAGIRGRWVRCTVDGNGTVQAHPMGYEAFNFAAFINCPGGVINLQLNSQSDYKLSYSHEWLDQLFSAPDNYSEMVSTIKSSLGRAINFTNDSKRRGEFVQYREALYELSGEPQKIKGA